MSVAWDSGKFGNLFYATFLFLHLLKTSKNLWFSGDMVRELWHENGLME